MAPVLDSLLEGFDDRRHPRGFHGRFIATFAHPVHGRTTSPIEASSPTEAWSKAEAQGRRSGSVVQSVVPHEPDTGRGGLDVLGLGREGRAARERGASARTTEHADMRDKLTNLPQGHFYALHGPQGAVGHVQRTAKGWEITDSSTGAPKVHATPSSAAGHAMRIQRKAASSREQANVMARNYRAGAEVRLMNERQAKRAEQEAARQRQIRDRHGGYAVGDRVTYREPSIVNGKVDGYGPEQTREVAGLQRNGYLRLREPKFGTTVDVHHSKVRRG